MDILRFITAGSVDDGKSTLIGRLLYDSKSILADQLAAIEKQSKNKENGEIDLAILTDGLRAEREQGITIDVAYKYFSTPKRKFIIADAPGHIQYTRNMVTGASNADLAIILIDARKGVIEQTKRHSLIASLLGISHIVVAVNKMDLVDYSETVFNTIQQDYQLLIDRLQLKNVHFIPISALSGDNIVEKSARLNWHQGPALLEFLEEVELRSDINLSSKRFPVQYVIRPQTEELHDYRGYAGKITSGIYKKGQEVMVLPSGIKSSIKSLEIAGKEVEEAFAPQSIVMQLTDDIDISRGEMIVAAIEEQPVITQEINVMLCWMDTKTLEPGNKYIIQHNTRQTRCVVKEIEYRLNINSLEKEEQVTSIQLNDVCRILLKTATPLCVDEYANNKNNGAAILIDETSYVTVGACIMN